ncbi:MAG: tetratricopeptide repeat protein [Anaerolineae bacterium]
MTDTLTYWMPALRQHHKDYNWLSTKVDKLYLAITFAVNRPPEHRLAIEALNLLYQYILIYGDWERWVRLWYDCLRNAQGVRDSTAQTHIWREMGGLYASSGNHKRGRAAFMNFLDRAKENGNVELVLTGYIGLISLQTISQDATFNDEMVNAALKLAERVDMPRLWAELHKALAMAYTARHQTVQAFAHGQMAYCYWRKLDEPIEMARVAFTLAQTCRVIERFQLARSHLNLSRSLYARTPSGARYAALDYEEGLLNLDQGDYPAAAQWFENVVLEFGPLQQQFYHAAALHSLAITYAHLERYDESQARFEEALKIWQSLENYYEQANLYFGWAEMEKHRDNPVRCLECLYEGLRICEELPDTPARHKLEEGMNDILDKISKPL